MHTMKTLSEGILLLLLMFFAELSGCSDQAFYVMDDAVEYEYEQYTDYDERELEEQINGYWKYMETSEKKQEEIIGEAQIQADPSENHTGKTAGEEIIYLSGIAEYDQLSTYDYVTVVTDGIISTNIYGIKP